MGNNNLFILLILLVILLASALTVFVVLFIRRDKALRKYLFPDHHTNVNDNPDTRLLQDLKTKMEDERVFTDCSLTLDKLAKQLGTNRSTLSKAINTNMGVNFSTFLNSYRIKEAIRIFNSDTAHKSYKIESIGQMCGFNTRQAFHRAFKQETGMNTRQYLKKLKKDDKTCLQ